jgi:hypothetical protein
LLTVRVKGRDAQSDQLGLDRIRAISGVAFVRLVNTAARPRARAAVLAGFLLALIAAVPAAAATRQVAPLGADAGDCRLAPCASFGYAYGQSANGDVISVAAGTYSPQHVPSGSKAVTFVGGPGVQVRQVDNQASNVVYDGINVDAGGTKTSGAAFELGGSGVTVRNATIGNVVDEKGMLARGANHTIDNVTFHDAVYKTDGVHMECLYALQVPGFTLRNSTFHDCAIMDVFFTYGSWWSPKPPAYGNVTIENNVFSHPEMENNSGWMYYSLYVADTGPNGTGGDPMNGWVVRNNTFESPAFISSSGGSNGTRWVGNLGSWDCKSGITYRSNVGKACSSQDKAVSPASSSANQTAAFGWADPRGGDFRLTSGSPAIDAASPADAPSSDRRGFARDARPDAGAYEFGATGPGAPSTPGPGSTARRRPALRSARLRPKRICVRPRRGCPRTGRLRVKTARATRVTVRVKRVRGRRARLVRRLGFRPARRNRASITARRLAPGRYRVVVRAVRGDLRSKARVLRLTVR